MFWFRVDNRLVHGQVIEAWLPYTAARHLVVSNDSLVVDPLRQQIVSLAVPQRVQMHFCSLAALPDTLAACGEESTLVLLENCQDVERIIKQGVVIATLNVGNLHYGPGKRQLLPHVAVTDDEANFLHDLSSSGTQLDFRSVPAEKVRGLDELFV